MVFHSQQGITRARFYGGVHGRHLEEGYWSVGKIEREGYDCC